LECNPELVDGIKPKHGLDVVSMAAWTVLSCAPGAPLTPIMAPTMATHHHL
jgi:hypothetical protein